MADKSAEKRIFGTDGIRDIANTGYLSVEWLTKLGQVVGTSGQRHQPASRAAVSARGRKVIIGRDTRASGPMIESALSKGLLAVGANVIKAGVISTPGLAYLSQRENCALGIMISASHNPAEYNGIKLFGSNGMKLPEAAEKKIEKRLHAVALAKTKVQKAGTVLPIATGDLIKEYTRDLAQKIIGDKMTGWGRGMKIVIDCANGALSKIAPAFFSELGATVVPINCRPDGQNINHRCGSLFPESLRRKVISEAADIGFSFDGDADRVILVDDKGVIRDGDYVLYVAARYLKKRHLLRHNTVVGTIMTNSALANQLQKEGMKLLRTPVGDKYILAEMLKGNFVLGGEQSGHIIFADYSLNGDGLVTALAVLKILKDEKKPLSALIGSFTQYPQHILNVPVKSKPPLDQIKAVQDEVAKITTALGNSGRLNLRYSGTEYLARIMIEGPDSDYIKSLVKDLAVIIKKTLG